MSNGLPCGGINEPKKDEVVSLGFCQVSGWALDTVAPLRAVLITLDDQNIAQAHPCVAPEEVAVRYAGLPHAATCGWQVMLDLRSYPRGHAVLGVTALTVAGVAIPLDGVRIVLEGEVAGVSRNRCVFTMVQNEAIYLPLWLSYYRRHFEGRDMYVLDHNTKDGSTTGLGDQCNVIHIHHETSYDSYWLKSTVEQFQSFLLNSYETVLFAEVDEFVVANPSCYEGLADYIQQMPGVMSCCTGYEVVQDPRESVLNFEQPLLQQRAYWHPSPDYSKTLLSKVPLRWTAGFHDTLHPPSGNPDPDLVLAHLHRVDYEYCRVRHENIAQRKWSKSSLAKGHGGQSRIFEPKAFNTWFYEKADAGNAPREPIPDQYRKAF